MNLKEPKVVWETKDYRIVVSCETQYARESFFSDPKTPEPDPSSRLYLAHVLESSNLDAMGETRWTSVDHPDPRFITAVVNESGQSFSGWRDPKNWIIPEPKVVERIESPAMGPYR